MSAFFPRLFPDELLYSAVARFRDAARFPSERAVMKSVFGASIGAAVTGLPGRLESFLACLPPGHGIGARDLAHRHTTLPYYTKFLPPRRAQRTERAICESDSSVAYGLIGLRACTVEAPHRLQYCPACVAEEQAALDAAYWHRACQLPGVLVCPRHRRSLCESSVRVSTRENVHRFVSLDVATANGKGTPVTLPKGTGFETLLGLASGTAWLLSSRAKPLGLPALRRRHHALLGRRGLLTAGGNVRVSQLRRGIVSSYGPGFLGLVGCGLSPDGSKTDDWLARLLHKPRTSHHPLRHLLLTNHLGVSPADFLGKEAPPSTCAPPKRATSNYGPAWETELKRLVTEGDESLRGIAQALGVDPKTVQRHARRLGIWRAEWATWDASAPGKRRKAAARRTLARHRATWRALQERHPAESTQQLRSRAPGAYSYLYRYARPWLRANQPARQQPRARAPRVDWAARDRKLQRCAEKAVAQMLAAPGRPVRISPTAVARRMGSLAVVLQNARKLPKTTAFLASAAESRSDFARRRIAHTARRFAEEGTLPPKWIFVRRAGLREDLAALLDADVSEALRELAADPHRPNRETT